MIVHQLQAKSPNSDEWEVLKEDTNLSLIQKSKEDWESVNNTREYRIMQVEKDEMRSSRVNYTPSFSPSSSPSQTPSLTGDGSVIGGCALSFLIFALMFIIRRFKCVPVSSYFIAFFCIVALGVILSIRAKHGSALTWTILYHAALSFAYLLFV